jgi:prephenate dehydratase
VRRQLTPRGSFGDTRAFYFIVKSPTGMLRFMKKIAIQGEHGSFHEVAAHKILGSDVGVVPKKTFADVFASVENSETFYGICGVENSLYGSINVMYKLLEKSGLWVAGETFLKVDQYLIAKNDHEVGYFNKPGITVMSQVMAIAQADNWLQTHLPKVTRKEYHDTAASVQYVMNSPDDTMLAVASKAAAELYGAKIIAGPINDDPHNYTRFFLLTKTKQDYSDATKTSIILTTGHDAGDLYRALGVFADKGVNLSKLDSHPIVGERWHYAFYVDFDLGLNNPISTEILNELESQGCSVQILGSYKGAKLPI